jgi:hypothetical protein
LLLFVVLAVLQIPTSFSPEGLPGLVLAAYQLLVIGPVGLGFSYAFLRAARGLAPDVGDLFAPFQRAYHRSVIAGVVLPLLIAVGFLPAALAAGLATLATDTTPRLIAALATLVFAAGGAALMTRLLFAPYLVVDEQRGVIDAIGESWQRSAPVAWQLFGALLIAIPIAIGGLLLLLIGLVPATMWTALATAIAFLDATERAGALAPSVDDLRP